MTTAPEPTFSRDSSPVFGGEGANARRASTTPGFRIPKPCVLYSESGHRGALLEVCSIEAARAGLRPQMTLAEAQALLAEAIFAPYCPDEDKIELQRLAWDCEQFSPIVGIERAGQQHCLVFDIKGCAGLFGGEESLQEQVVEFFWQQGYSVRVALADAVGAAWALAVFGETSSLAQLPVEALRLPADVVTKLRRFDLNRIGNVLALPASTLPSRFGAILTERLEQVTGQRSELIIPERRPEIPIAEWSSDVPVSGREIQERICEELLEQLVPPMHERREGVLRLQIEFVAEASSAAASAAAARPAAGPAAKRAPAGSAVLELGLVQPSDSAAHMLSLLRLRFERDELPDEFHTVRMKAVQTGSTAAAQRTLFGLEPDQNAASLQKLLDRLSNRLGASSVVRARLQPEPLPERAVTYEPVIEAGAAGRPEQATRRSGSKAPTASNRKTAGTARNPGAAGAAGAAGTARSLFTAYESAKAKSPGPATGPATGLSFAAARPLELFSQPIEIDVQTSPDGSPIRFEWKGRTFRIIHSTRPERIETAWWEAGEPIRRDYRRVETSTGHRFWLFKNADDDWHLHGTMS